MEKLVKAAKAGHAERVRALLEEGASPHLASRETGERALLVAAALGHVPVVEELLNQGARIDLRDDDGRNALALAARAGERRVVELLLHRGASIDMRDDGDEKDREALQWVCEMVRNGQS